jgi:hypothetical protein
MTYPMFSVIEFLRASWRRFLTVCACGCVLIAMATYVFLSIGAPVAVIAAYAILVHAIAMMQIPHPGAGITIDRRGLHWHSPPPRRLGAG